MAHFESGGCYRPTSAKRIKILQLWTLLYILLKIGSVLGEDKPGLGRFVGYSSLPSGSLDLIDLSSYAKAVPAQDRSDEPEESGEASVQETKPEVETTTVGDSSTTEEEKGIEYLPFPYKNLPVLVYEKKTDGGPAQLSYQMSDEATLSVDHHIYELKETGPDSTHHVFELKQPARLVAPDESTLDEKANDKEGQESESKPEVVEDKNATDSTNETIAEASETVAEDAEKINATEDGELKGDLSEVIQPGSLVTLSHGDNEDGHMVLTAVEQPGFNFASSESQPTFYAETGAIDTVYGKPGDFDQVTTTLSPIDNEANPPVTDGYQLSESQIQGQVAYQQFPRQGVYPSQFSYQPVQSHVAYQDAGGQLYQPVQGQSLFQTPQGQILSYGGAQGQEFQYQSSQGLPVQYQGSHVRGLQYQGPQESAQGQGIEYQQTSQGHEPYQGREVAYQNAHGQTYDYQTPQSSVQYQTYENQPQQLVYQQSENHANYQSEGEKPSQSKKQVVYHDAHGDIVYQDEKGELSYQPTQASNSFTPTPRPERQESVPFEGNANTQIYVNEPPQPSDGQVAEQQPEQKPQQPYANGAPGTVQLYYSSSQESPSQMYPPSNQYNDFGYDISSNFASRKSVQHDDQVEEPKPVEIGRRYSPEPEGDNPEPTEPTRQQSSTTEAANAPPKISAKTDAFEQFLREHMRPQPSEQYQTYATPPTGMFGSASAVFGTAENPFGGFQGNYGSGGNLGIESAPFGSSVGSMFSGGRSRLASMIESLTGQASTMNIRGGMFGGGGHGGGGHGGSSHGFNPFQSGASDNVGFGSQIEPSTGSFGGFGDFGRFAGFQGYGEDSLALGSQLGGGGGGGERGQGGDQGHFGRLTGSESTGFGDFRGGQRDRYRHGIEHAHYDVNEQLATESQTRPSIEAWKQDARPQFSLEWKPDQKPELRPLPNIDWKPDQKPELRPQFNLDWKPDQKPEMRPQFNLDWKPDQKPEMRPQFNLDWKPDQKPLIGVTGYGNQAVSQAFTANHRARPFKEIEDAIAFLKQVPPENIVGPHRGQFLFRPEEKPFPNEVRNPLLEFVDKQIKEQLKGKPDKDPVSSTPKPTPIPAPPQQTPAPTTPKPPTYHIVHNIMHSIIHKAAMVEAAQKAAQLEAAQKEAMKMASQEAQRQAHMAKERPIIQNGHVYRKQPVFGERIKPIQTSSSQSNVAITHQGAPIIIYQGIRPPVHPFNKAPQPLKPKPAVPQIIPNFYKPPQALREHKGPALRATVGKVGSFNPGQSVSYYHRPLYPDFHKPTKLNVIDPPFKMRIPTRPLSKPSLRPTATSPLGKPTLKPLANRLTTQKSTSYSTVFRYAGFEFPKYQVPNATKDTTLSKYSPPLKLSESGGNKANASTPIDTWTGGQFSHKSEKATGTGLNFKPETTSVIGIRRSSPVTGTEGFGGAGTWIPVAKQEESKYVKAVPADASDKIMYTPRNA